MEPVLAGDPGIFQGGLHHSQRSVAVAAHDSLAQGAVVGADTHRAAELFADFQKRQKFLFHPLQGRLVHFGRACLHIPVC